MNIYNFGIENLTANFVLGEGLKIEWTTFGLPGNVSYYKSEVPLDLNNMPSLTFANISGSTYTDPNTSNKVCYIAVGVTKNGVSKFSNVVKYLDGELSAPTNVTFEVVKY